MRADFDVTGSEEQSVRTPHESSLIIKSLANSISPEKVGVLRRDTAAATYRKTRTERARGQHESSD